MNIKIINAELGIASCSRDQVAEDIRNPSTVIFFYYQKRDQIVFNADHPDYDLFLELVQGYMELDEEQKAAFLKLVDMERVRKPLEVVDQILRIRKENLMDMCGGGNKRNPRSSNS